MKNIIKSMLGIILLSLFLCSVVWAETSKIAVFDFPKCLTLSNEGKRVLQDLKDKRISLNKILGEKQQELVELQKDFEKQSALLNSEAKADKKKEFERKGRELEYLIKDLTDDMKETELKVQKDIESDVQKIIIKIAQDGNLDLVREKNSKAQDIWYASEKIDITDRVIEEYNKLKP